MKITKYLLLWTSLLLVGCSTKGHLTRYDRQPGGLVDEKALGVKYPLCLRSDQKSLRLTNELVDDDLRSVIWTRHDGTTRLGTWYMSKSSSNTRPRRENVNVWISWPTPKNNPFVKLSAALIFAHKLAEDEQTPNTLWQLSDFTACSKK